MIVEIDIYFFPFSRSLTYLRKPKVQVLKGLLTGSLCSRLVFFLNLRNEEEFDKLFYVVQ